MQVDDGGAPGVRPGQLHGHVRLHRGDHRRVDDARHRDRVVQRRRVEPEHPPVAAGEEGEQLDRRAGRGQQDSHGVVMTRAAVEQHRNDHPSLRHLTAGQAVPAADRDRGHGLRAFGSDATTRS